MCNCSYARTFFISSYANLFIYEQFNKFIKIQQVEIFLFFIIWGQPLLWESQRSGWPRPWNAGFKPILWCGFWRLFQKVAKISVSDALVVSFSFLSLFFFSWLLFCCLSLRHGLLCPKLFYVCILIYSCANCSFKRNYSGIKLLPKMRKME